MTPTEAIARVERLFTVHEDAGYPADWIDQNGKVLGSAVDMTLAPCGEAYVTLTSYGVEPELPAMAIAMFQSQSVALQWWVDEVEDYAASIMVERDQWKRLHLYWRTKPAFHKTTYLAMDQASLLGTKSPLAAILQIDLGFVTSEMLISKLGPDGKEG